MSRSPSGAEPPGGRRGQIVRPVQLRPPDRQISLGVSQPSDDPSRHRVFEVRAVFDAMSRGWVAHVGERDRNEQRGAWGPLTGTDGQVRVSPTAAACLGNAVATIVAMTDRDADNPAESG